MAGRWRVDGTNGIWLVRGDARAALAMRGRAIGGEAAAARVDAWFPEGWWGERAATLAAIGRALEGAFAGSEAADAGRLKAALRRALRDGRVTAVQVELLAPAGEVEKEEKEPATVPRAAREEKTWIEIVLVDDDDPPRPVAFARYRIELPDGSPREGILDEHGRARIVEIDPGECRVTFPDLDWHDWTQAKSLSR